MPLELEVLLKNILVAGIVHGILDFVGWIKYSINTSNTIFVLFEIAGGRLLFDDGS